MSTFVVAVFLIPTAIGLGAGAAKGWADRRDETVTGPVQIVLLDSVAGMFFGATAGIAGAALVGLVTAVI